MLSAVITRPCINSREMMKGCCAGGSDLWSFFFFFFLKDILVYTVRLGRSKGLRLYGIGCICEFTVYLSASYAI